MSITRRGLLGGVTAASYLRLKGANDRVGVGFIGYGLIGAQHVKDFANQRDAELAAMCDVYQPRLEQGVAACGGRAKAYRDFRRLLDDKNVQAVVVSTPDHWHALLTILACAAGKDVYVEKPLTLFMREGRWMVNAARRFQRVVQTGSQQRSGTHYRKAYGMLQAGRLGQVFSARAGAFRNVMPGFGRFADAPAPAGFDYDMWLGPAPARPYNAQRGLYHFRWFWDYSGGQMTNLGAHTVDIVQWYLNVKGPTTVSSAGGRYVLEGDGETPDTQFALFEYPKFLFDFGIREGGGSRRSERLEFYGTNGTLAIGRSGFELTPDHRIAPESAIPIFAGNPAGGPKRPAESGGGELRTQPAAEPGSSEEQLDRHVRDFLDCVKSRRRPHADVEDGHRTATACHLANISLRTGRKIRWDPEREEILGDREASAMLERPYRKPWDEALRALHL
jgi:predicted dehydrogenase